MRQKWKIHCASFLVNNISWSIMKVGEYYMQNLFLNEDEYGWGWSRWCWWLCWEVRKLLSMCTGTGRYALHQLSPTWLSLCLYPDIPVEFIVKFSLLYTVYLNIPVEFIVKFTAIQCLKLPMQKSQKRYSVYSRYSTLVEQPKPAGYVHRAVLYNIVCMLCIFCICNSSTAQYLWTLYLLK